MLDILAQAMPLPTCSSKSCKEESVYRGLCSLHYKDKRKEVLEAKRPKTILEKVFASAKADNNGCLNWTKGSQKRHARITVGGIRAPVHAVVFERFYGRVIADGMEVHHKCENPQCVNPEHLELLTHVEHRKRHPMVRDRKTGRIIRKKS